MTSFTSLEPVAASQHGDLIEGPPPAAASSQPTASLPHRNRRTGVAGCVFGADTRDHRSGGAGASQS
ncbi:hypothetical protein [Synechococcus sp. UW140]|uniref:hypothetical protein n=1 Tax=Synechococcus sp. UW140 TaxID=368503 RepID=UPI003137A867